MEQTLYDLPKGWEWKRVHEVAKQYRHTLHPLPHQKYNYIGLEHIQSHTGKLLGDDFQIQGNKINSTKVEFKEGMVLYSKLRPYLNKVFIADFEGIASTEMIPFACSHDLNPEFLAYYLRTQYFVDLAVGNCSGLRMPRVSTKFLTKTASIPLTSLPEQQRIVAKLDALLSRIDKAVAFLLECLTLLDKACSSALEDVVNPLHAPQNAERPYHLPAGREWKKNDDLCNKIIHEIHRIPEDTKTGEPLIALQDIRKGVIDFSNTRFVSPATRLYKQSKEGMSTQITQLEQLKSCILGAAFKGEL